MRARREPDRRGAAVLVAPLLTAVLVATGCVRRADTPSDAAAPAVLISGDVEHGEALFGQKGCIGCHTISGIGGQVGPNLTDVSRRDLARERPGRTWPDVAAYIRESIQTPQAYVVPGFPDPSPMPSAQQFELSNRDIESIIAYLFSLAARSR